MEDSSNNDRTLEVDESASSEAADGQQTPIPPQGQQPTAQQTPMPPQGQQPTNQSTPLPNNNPLLFKLAILQFLMFSIYCYVYVEVTFTFKKFVLNFLIWSIFYYFVPRQVTSMFEDYVLVQKKEAVIEELNTRLEERNAELNETRRFLQDQRRSNSAAHVNFLLARTSKNQLNAALTLPGTETPLEAEVIKEIIKILVEIFSPGKIEKTLIERLFVLLFGTAETNEGLGMSDVEKAMDNHTELQGPHIELDLNQEDAQHLLASIRDVKVEIQSLIWYTKKHLTSRNDFVRSYRERGPETQVMTRVISQTFQAIFNIFENNIQFPVRSQYIFDRTELSRRFPNIYEWAKLAGEEFPNTEARHLRNAVAHNFGVLQPVPIGHRNEHHRRFDPGEFYNNITDWLPGLLTEVNDLEYILANEIRHLRPRAEPYVPELIQERDDIDQITEEDTNDVTTMENLGWSDWIRYQRLWFQRGLARRFKWYCGWMQWITPHRRAISFIAWAVSFIAWPVYIVLSYIDSLPSQWVEHDERELKRFVVERNRNRYAAPADWDAEAAPTDGDTGAAPADWDAEAAPTDGDTGAAPTDGDTGPIVTTSEDPLVWGWDPTVVEN